MSGVPPVLPHGPLQTPTFSPLSSGMSGRSISSQTASWLCIHPLGSPSYWTHELIYLAFSLTVSGTRISHSQHCFKIFYIVYSTVAISERTKQRDTCYYLYLAKNSWPFSLLGISLESFLGKHVKWNKVNWPRKVIKNPRILWKSWNRLLPLFTQVCLAAQTGMSLLAL